MSTCEQQEITVYRGEALDLELDIFEPNWRVQDLNGISQITVTFTDQDGNFLSKNLSAGVTVVNADAGQITVTLSTGDTGILPEQDKQTFGVFLEYSDGRKRNVEYERVLNVKKRTGGA